MSIATSGSVRGRVLPPLAPARPPGRTPLCEGRAWDDVPPEQSAVPSGLLLGDEELATRDRR